MLLSISIFAVCYIFIASEKVEKSIVALLGAAAVICLHQVPYEEALGKVDLNVIFLLLGMMIIVNILSDTGLFEWVAVTLAHKSGGNGLLVVIFLLGVTALFSAFLDNVTTVILIAPITILLMQILELPAAPILILEAIFSNIGGTATLVGDPPNILIGSQTQLDFNDFLIHLGPVVVVIFLLLIGLVGWLLRNRLCADKKARQRVMKAEPRRAITDPVALRKALPVFGLVLGGFFFGRVLDIEPGIVALAGALLMALICKTDVSHAVSRVEWNTILFFIGLFMMVAALEYNGVFEQLGGSLLALTGDHLLATVLILLWASALMSAIVDNIPLVIAMIPLVHSIVPAFAVSTGLEGSPELVQAQIRAPLFWALALGACLGGNGSLIGASANVVIAQVAKRNKYELSFMQFMRWGFPVMLVSLVVSSIYLYLRYFVFS
ncbi:MAG: ArsB/NhaD family transporter [Lentisphaeria bacterium]